MCSCITCVCIFPQTKHILGVQVFHSFPLTPGEGLNSDNSYLSLFREITTESNQFSKIVIIDI